MVYGIRNSNRTAKNNNNSRQADSAKKDKQTKRQLASHLSASRSLHPSTATCSSIPVLVLAPFDPQSQQLPSQGQIDQVISRVSHHRRQRKDARS